MLEKDNELIVKSLDSQAINISNNLLQSHKKLDDFFYTANTKFNEKMDNMLERINQSNAHISNSLGALSGEAKSGLDSISALLNDVYNKNAQTFAQNMQNSFDANANLMKNINEHLNAFVGNFSSASNSFSESASNITKHLESLQMNNEEMSVKLMKQNADFAARFYESLEANLSNFNEKIVSQFSSIINKNNELLNSLESKITNFEGTLSGFDSSVKTSFEGLNANFKNLCVQYIKLMQASMQTNIKNQQAAASEFNKAVTSVRDNVAGLMQQSSSLFNAQKASLDSITQTFSQNTQVLTQQGKLLQENINSNLTNLDSKLEQMTQGFANNYEWFLKRVKDLMGS